LEIIRIIGLASVVLITRVPQTQPPQVSGSEVKKHLGRDVTICGRVVTYDCELSSRSLLLDLNSPNWASGVSVAINREYWGDIGGHQLTNRYLFADVCASGKVEKAGRRYRVIVRGSDQLPSINGRATEASGFAPTAIQSCAEGVTPPSLVSEVKPDYTREAMDHRQEGRVYIEAVVLPDGSVGDIRALYALKPDYGLTQQAIRAVMRWRFRAGTLRGIAEPVVITVVMSFALRG
jgi:TonB family protein